MCFSPEVDLAAGLLITGVAVDAIRHCPDRRHLPAALLPALFAVHTFTDAFVWWGLRGQVPVGVAEFATTFYLVVAFALLPIWVPLAVWLVEPNDGRRPARLALVAAGLVAGLDFARGIAVGDCGAVACGYYIDFDVAGSPITGGLYVLATCGVLLLSKQPALFRWGVVNFAVVAILAVSQNAGLPSLWCLWAAVTSFFVAWYLRRLPR